ncbi:helix-turn-helix domain-containing protein [Micromonospora humidisoli]|uniref:Helix-turn-helix transcriptional regulator n=1 Tax=Micromonospora humidisoli TaxID=2807622 RepID=A0ABS2J9Q4_9ACTN|nr:helix-turn-helix transcriptional regulator [Micromonospora humidisoli]MBM7083248.1 helix-turn-helix transcriptional regulator [Micromonospora humidisoli]
MPARARDATPNLALYNLRDAGGQTQQDVADALNRLGLLRGKKLAITANQVSRWERGITYPSALYRQLLAEHFGVSVQTLGLTRQRITPDQAISAGVDSGGLVIHQGSDVTVHPQVAANQDEWRAVRRKLNGHRVPLAREAARLYGSEYRLGDTGLITAPGWLPSAPVEVSEFGIAFSPASSPPLVTGTEDAAAAVRPLIAPDRRHQRYSLALRDVEQPQLFENRLAWHLTGVDWLRADRALTFTEGTYFGGVDVSEALAHEMAASHITGDGSGILPASWRNLAFRRLAGDPFASGRWPVVPSSVDTLTLRVDPDGVTFVLHHRAAGKVAMAGGTLHIMPAGVFQPSSVLPAAQADDFDLWRNIVREYSEEFLGNAEHGGEGAPANYHAEPLASLVEAYQAGGVRVFCLGVALDALTLWGEILTVAVFDGPTYDRLFADMVTFNAEVTIVTTGRLKPTSALPFTRHTIDEITSGGQLAPAAAGCIELAWEHRRTILDRG